MNKKGLRRKKIEELYGEVNILKKLKHPNIIRFQNVNSLNIIVIFLFLGQRNRKEHLFNYGIG